MRAGVKEGDRIIKVSAPPLLSSTCSPWPHCHRGPPGWGWGHDRSGATTGAGVCLAAGAASRSPILGPS